MDIKHIRDILINEDNVKFMCKKQSKDFNVKRLLNNYNLDQSQCVRFGKLFERFIIGVITKQGYEIIHKGNVDINNEKIKI